MKVTAVIMAGGKGERFWPKSRRNFPKQFLSLTDDGISMIQHTVNRILPLVDIADIYVVTNKEYVSLVEEQLPQLSLQNILAEPLAKNTAPCIGFAATVIQKKYGDAVMLVLPSDHLIKYNEIYIDTLKLAIGIAQEADDLVTIGITPTYPETGYGYINFVKDEETNDKNGIYKVNKLVEKPKLDLAKEYLNSGKYLWNSGMFVWKSSTILGNIKEFLPNIYSGLIEIGKAYNTEDFDKILYECFYNFKSESVDYGILEKSKSIFTIPGNFGWDDVGNWISLERINVTNDFGNVVKGDVITINTNNSIICGEKKLIATVGVEDLIVVDTDNAILICSKDSTQDVKKVIENLKICNRTELI